MGSTRLPGKMAMKLADNHILNWVVTRTLKSKKIDKLVLATSTNSIDDVIEKLLDASQIILRRGPEKNVLKRFTQVADEFSPEIVLRVCADNPFVDGEQLDHLIDKFIASDFDLVFNNAPKLSCNYADGFGAEAFRYTLLNKLAASELSREQEEHVTKYIYDNSQCYSIFGLPAPNELAYPNINFDVNTISDYNKLARLIQSGVHMDMRAADIIKIYLGSK